MTSCFLTHVHVCVCTHTHTHTSPLIPFPFHISNRPFLHLLVPPSLLSACPPGTSSSALICVPPAPNLRPTTAISLWSVSSALLTPSPAQHLAFLKPPRRMLIVEAETHHYEAEAASTSWNRASRGPIAEPGKPAVTPWSALCPIP